LQKCHKFFFKKNQITPVVRRQNYSSLKKGKEKNVYNDHAAVLIDITKGFGFFSFAHKILKRKVVQMNY